MPWVFARGFCVAEGGVAHRKQNEHYFSGQLEEPVITIQSTPRAFGHVTVGKAWIRGQENRHELNIGAGTLSRDIEDVVATMLHEMVHLYNMAVGVQDTSRGGAYHNKRFKAAAEQRDLLISYDPRIGWSITKPTDKLLAFILEQGWGEIHMNRNEGLMIRGGGTPSGSPGAAPKTGKGSNSRKYQCPCCGCSVRATKAVNVACLDCGMPMVLVSGN